jgi:hypothetical protein
MNGFHCRAWEVVGDGDEMHRKTQSRLFVNFQLWRSSELRCGSTGLTASVRCGEWVSFHFWILILQVFLASAGAFLIFYKFVSACGNRIVHASRRRSLLRMQFPLTFIYLFCLNLNTTFGLHFVLTLFCALTYIH